MKLNDIKIKSKNSADNKDLIVNINTNLDTISRWVEPCWQHQEKALIVSGGRSLSRHIEKIKEKQKEGYAIFCVKHSFPKLVAAGIEPDVVVILDPRPLEGYSTHGIQRKDLYENIPQKTMFFVASMTHPSVTQHLFSIGANVVGWHPAVTGLVEVLTERKINGVMINDGTSSATRSVGLLKMMGFRHIEMVAFDSDVLEPSEEEKRQRNVEGPAKYTQIVSDDGTVYWSTGELLAQVQDIRHLVKIYANSHITLEMWDGGLGYAAFQAESRIQEEISRGGGLTGFIPQDYEVQMQSLRDPKTFQLQIAGSDNKLVTIVDQGVIRRFLASVGLSWDTLPVLQ
jgi:hypothetical protein